LHFADGRSESVGESRFRIFCLSAGLPAPELQVEIRNVTGSFVARSDFAYLESGLLIEFDGMIKYGKRLLDGHTPQEALVMEERREDHLRELGWHVLRVTWADLGAPALLETRIRAAMLRGSRAAAANPIMGSAQPKPLLGLPRR